MREKIAFLTSDRLGDSLIGMVSVVNLERMGFQVTVFSDYIYGLKDWFANFNVKPYPSCFDNVELWQSFDKIVVMFDRPFVATLKHNHKSVEVMSWSPIFKLSISMVDIQLEYCKVQWGAERPVRHNGISPPVSDYKKNRARVAIHPTSSDDSKVWPKSKFLELYQCLQKKGYDPFFMVAPSEYRCWENIVADGFQLKCSSKLTDVARLIYECRFFIGSDSGLGHLASCLGVPTVSIMIRRGTARMWSPSWANCEAVLAPSWLFCRPLKEKYWKKALTISRVVKAFGRLADDSA